MREFYIKETLMRFVLGFVSGAIVSMGVYGPGPVKELEDTSGVDETSIEYSVEERKKYYKRNEYLPGRIRND